MSLTESSQNRSATYTQPTDDWQQRMDEKKLDAGQLGRLFGTGDSAPSNIAGLAVLGGLAIGGLVSGVLLLKSNAGTSDVTEIWKYIAPIVTAALGYLFGKGRP